jgi:hypothetical protein
MLMKLTTGVNFINIFCQALTHAYPKSTKNTDDLTVFFALLGSALVKAALEMFVKLTTGRCHIACLESKSSSE